VSDIEQTPAPESWGFALETEPTTTPVVAIAAVIQAYVDSGVPDEVADLLAGVPSALVYPKSSTEGARYVVRVGGRATADHACIAGPDELLTISVTVLDPAPESAADTAATTVVTKVEGGSFIEIG
jgi:hypothetical protein